MERPDLPAFLSPTIEDFEIFGAILNKSLKCKCIALVLCITGTVILFLLPLDFIESSVLAIILPSFTTGYIFINVAGILTACRGHLDLLADICFSSCGSSVNACCSLYLLYYWIDWTIGTLESGNGIEGTLFLMLSATCFLNTIAMGAQLIFSILEMRRRVAGDDDR